MRDTVPLRVVESQEDWEGEGAEEAVPPPPALALGAGLLLSAAGLGLLEALPGRMVGVALTVALALPPRGREAVLRAEKLGEAVTETERVGEREEEVERVG